MDDADDDGQAAPPSPAATPQTTPADAPAPAPDPASAASSPAEPDQSVADASVAAEPDASVEPSQSDPATISPEDAGSESSVSLPQDGGTDGPTTNGVGMAADGSAQPDLTDEHYDWIHKMCGKNARGDGQAADGGSASAADAEPGGMTGATPNGDSSSAPNQSVDPAVSDPSLPLGAAPASAGDPAQTAAGAGETGEDQPDFEQADAGAGGASGQQGDQGGAEGSSGFDPTVKTAGAGFTKTPEQVEKEVTDKYGTFITKDHLDDPASKVTNFQDDATFQNELNTRHPKLAEMGIDPKSVMGESYKGQIYINKDKADIGTAYHEQMHHYSNAEFIKRFSAVGGVKFNEGVTEYLTRQTYSGDRSGHYDTEEKLAEAISKKVGEDVLKKAYFQGDEAAMKKVTDALAGK